MQSTTIGKNVLALVFVLDCILLANCSSSWLGLNRQQAEKYYQTALKLKRSGHGNEAISLLKRATANYRRFAEAYYELGNLLLEQNTLESRIQARDALERAVQYAPHNILYRLALARLYLNQEFYASAKKALDTILKQDSTVAEAWYNLGYVHELDFLHYYRMSVVDSSGATISFSDFAEKEFQQCLRYYQKAIETDPSYLPPYKRLAFLFYEQKDYSNMIAILKKAANVNSEDKQVHLYLGLAYFRVGNSWKSNEHFQAAWRQMDEEERMFYTSIEPLLSSEALQNYWRQTAAQRHKESSAYWTSRDPLFLTDFNERLQEHLCRIAYANLRLSLPTRNIEGWQTDRGKVLIRYGEPLEIRRTRAEIAARMEGGNPLIPSKEIWRYEDFDFVFEDRFLNRNYEFQWGIGADDDYLDRYKRMVARQPEQFKAEEIIGRTFALKTELRLFDQIRDSVASYLWQGLPVNSLFIRPYGMRNRTTARWEKGIFLFDSTWSSVKRRKLELELTAPNKYIAGSDLFVQLDSVKLSAGKHHLVVEYYQPAAKILFRANLPITTERVKSRKLLVSDLVLAQRIRLSSSPQQVDRANIEVVPNFDHKFLQGQPLYLYYEIYNRNLTGKGASTAYRVRHTVKQLTAEMNQFDKILSKLALKKMALTQVVSEFVLETAGSRENQFQMIELSHFPAGKYRLIVEVVDQQSNQSAQASVEFSIQKEEKSPGI